jgi:hypothetical protein
MDYSSHRPTDAFPQLSAAERLLIWGFRSLAQFRRLRWPTPLDIRQVYAHFSVADAVPALDAMFEAFACTAHTAIEVHSPTCPCMSAGEHGLLRAVSVAQHHRLDLARKQFECWLPPVAADWVLEPAQGLAIIFQAAGLMLPGRDSSEIGVRAAVVAMQSWPIGSPTLH